MSLSNQTPGAGRMIIRHSYKGKWRHRQGKWHLRVPRGLGSPLPHPQISTGWEPTSDSVPATRMDIPSVGLRAESGSKGPTGFEPP